MECVYESASLVRAVSGDPKVKVRCLVCHVGLKEEVVNTIKRHYTVQHNYQFKQMRKRDATTISRATEPSNTPKKPRLANAAGIFRDKDDLHRHCVKHLSQNALAYAYWDSPTTRRVYSVFEEAFKTSLRGRKMRDHVLEQSQRITRLIEEKLAGRMFSIKYDIGSRFMRSFLGISAQYMDNFEVKIVHIAMVVNPDRNYSETILNIIKLHLKNTGLNLEQVYSATTDNGKHQMIFFYLVFNSPE